MTDGSVTVSSATTYTISSLAPGSSCNISVVAVYDSIGMSNTVVITFGNTIEGTKFKLYDMFIFTCVYLEPRECSSFPSPSPSLTAASLTVSPTASLATSRQAAVSCLGYSAGLGVVSVIMIVSLTGNIVLVVKVLLQKKVHPKYVKK